MDDSFGASGSLIYFFNDLTFPIISDAPPNSTGSLTFELAPTHYDLRVENGSDDQFFVNGPGSQSGAEDDKLSFSITSTAPEPASWALMLLGIGGAGVALRRATGNRDSAFALDLG